MPATCLASVTLSLFLKRQRHKSIGHGGRSFKPIHPREIYMSQEIFSALHYTFHCLKYMYGTHASDATVFVTSFTFQVQKRNNWIIFRSFLRSFAGCIAPAECKTPDALYVGQYLSIWHNLCANDKCASYSALHSTVLRVFMSRSLTSSISSLLYRCYDLCC